MRIAQIAPLAEAVPPRLYGGTERIVSYLTEALVAQGHDVTLFASGDSRTRASLVACAPRALRLHAASKDAHSHIQRMLDEVRARAHRFDLLHFHTEPLHFPLFSTIAARTLTTVHGRLDVPKLQQWFRRFPEFPLVSVSDDQRGPLASMNWIATVPHGIPRTLLQPRCAARGDYLAFLGRLSPEKRPDLAIEIAARSSLPIRIAAKIDESDRSYVERYVRPLLDRPGVHFVGEISETQKSAFLSKARALLFPIDWPEPFGIVMIEAIACGTPVIGFRRGSVPEVIDDGMTGFCVADLSQAVRAVALVEKLDRPQIRRRFEERFSDVRMANDYSAVYQRVLREGLTVTHKHAVLKPSQLQRSGSSALSRPMNLSG